MKTVWLAVALAVVGLARSTPDASFSAVDSTIEDIRAHPFCDQTGRLSRDIIGDPPVTLWNTIIGAGEAGCASGSTLVVIVVAGSRGEYLGDSQARLVAIQVAEKADTLLDRTVQLGVAATDGHYYAGFWLYDTGCTPIRLDAYLSTAGRSERRTETIPFACGE